MIVDLVVVYGCLVKWVIGLFGDEIVLCSDVFYVNGCVVYYMVIVVSGICDDE